MLWMENIKKNEFMIFVTRNGKEEGPYSEEDLKKRLISNRLAINDLARHSWGSEWTPLAHLLDLSEMLNQPSSQNKRPAIVWVICVLYFTYFGLLTLLLVLARFVIPRQEWKNMQGERMGEILSASHLMQIFIWSSIAIFGAVMLVRLKRTAIYCFAAVLAVDVALAIYDGFSGGWFAAIKDSWPIGDIAWVIQIGVIYYSMHLIKRGVLK
jgi:hypothetical protein